MGIVWHNFNTQAVLTINDMQVTFGFDAKLGDPRRMVLLMPIDDAVAQQV